MDMRLSLQNVTGMTCDTNETAILTDAACVLRLRSISTHALEVWADFDGAGVRSPSYSIEESAGERAGLSVKDVDDVIVVSAGNVAVRVRKRGIRLDFVAADGQHVICEGCEMGKDDSGTVWMEHLIAENEHFYGLGEDNDSDLGSLDRRGRIRNMETGQRINAGRVTADIPVSFYMSTGRGMPYGVFTDNTYPMRYDMGATDPLVCRQSALGGDMVFYFFTGDTFGDLLNEYTNLTGKPPLPPLWVLGYTQCRCSYWSWEQIDELVGKLREHHIPVDCIVFDYDWAEHFNNYKWNARWQGQSPEKIAAYRAEGLHFMASNSGPMLKKDSDTYQSALDAGVLARDTDGKIITCGHFGGDLMDFSNPATKEWLRPQLERILDDGVEAWWLDLTEPEGDPENTVYFGGERNKIHNIFSLLCTKTYTDITGEHLPDMRSFVLTRTGTAGIQKYGAAIWSGDVYSDYETFSTHIPEALNTGMSGIPLWTCDAGGFISETSNAQDSRHLYQNDVARHANLYERWMQFAAFCPMMRAHHAGESAPYMFGSIVTDSVAHYIRLRYRLLPYIYSYAYRTHLTGESIMRPLVFRYPHDEHVYDLKDEFLFGDELLIAPVHVEEQCRREVYLPEGTWYDYDYGYAYEGGRSYDVYAPQNRIPVFVKAGAIIPVSGPISNTSEWDRSVISVEIYPSGKSSFVHYADDGKTNAYKKGQFTLTKICCTEGNGTVITTSASNSLFAARTLKLKIHVHFVPKAVFVGSVEAGKRGRESELDEKINGWYYDDFTRVLYVSACLDGLCGHVTVAYEKEAVRQPVRGARIEAGARAVPNFIFSDSLN